MREGPQPQSDRDYLVEIFQQVGVIQSDIAAICDRCEFHEGRLSSLEHWRERAVGVSIALGSGTVIAGLALGAVRLFAR